MIVSFTILDRDMCRTRRRTVRVFRSKADIEQATALVEKSPLEYKWPDGDVTHMRVEAISSPQARAIRQVNSGFLSYEWMVDSAMEHGRPINAFKPQEEAVCQ